MQAFLGDRQSMIRGCQWQLWPKIIQFSADTRGSSSLVLSSMTTVETRTALRFTKMCKYWKSKRCMMGDECNFAHSKSELKEQPDLVATQLCYQFSAKGMCSKGASCTFAHGRSELRPLREREGSPKDSEPMKVDVFKAPRKVVQSSLAQLVVPDSQVSAFATGFRPPPGLEPYTELDCMSTASTPSTFSLSPWASEPCSPSSPKSEIFWL